MANSEIYKYVHAVRENRRKGNEYFCGLKRDGNEEGAVLRTSKQGGTNRVESKGKV